LHEGARKGKVEVIKFLLSQGAKLDKLTFSGQNVLEIAYFSLDSDHKVIQFLENYIEENGIDIKVDPKLKPQVKEKDDTLYAHYAAQEGDLEVLKNIAEKKKELLFIADANGWTPFHESARAGNVDIIKFLIEAGSDLQQVTKNGETALDIALGQLSDDHDAMQYLKTVMGENKGNDEL